ncbi:MAG: hypothetical protein ACRDK9_08345 [Solirubrobacterales bacterium]
MQTKRIVACAAATAILVVPVAALAATKTYRGAVKGDPETSLKLRVEKEQGSRFFKAFAVQDLAIECDDGLEARLRSARVDGRAPLGDRGRFATRGESDRQVVRLKGKVRSRRASGTLRLSGSIGVEGETRDCRSGKVRWSAER